MTTAKKKTPLSAVVEAWQKRLELRDWVFDVRVVPRYEADSLGQCTVQYQRRDAEIGIADPKDWPGDSDAADPESTLVHELLHVVLHTMNHAEPGTVLYDTQEQSIIALERCLMKCGRVAKHGVDLDS